MPRYKLVIEYDGTPFFGWQFQAHGPTVQQALEDAIARFSGESVRIQGAGRTDTGVHATHQVAHVDLSRDWREDTVRDAVNAHLRPHPVAILSAAKVPEDFNARTSAVKRHYLYRIVTRRAPLTLERDHAWLVKWAVDAELMHDAAQALVGRHDFTTFRAAECQANSPVKTLERLDVERIGDEIRVFASARSFLHHQVRSIVGSLQLVGSRRWSKAELADALAARDRSRCGPLAPPGGLYLIGVDYPAQSTASSTDATA
ncbi:tRNA pseudouridine(38-40) synthase TruA [Alsobacter sp. SYSU M60028]|uniref:tRNA pseudouridine synthase A n=1 Tax=Alsobacter ponti TaxID=2962936 RepID=A0ABT1LHJ3_9HYPH|nr:tRNA pseudouridine(38-40) synthase TruA [Alsobacter ponti]MCP8940977.1 tRNA pseudouridine(38-40) synthase TruA [Alsobacter ponti]